MEKKIFCAGTCPICGHEDLDYNMDILDAEALVYTFTCPNCGNFGEERYSVEYIETVCFIDEEENKDGI